LLDFMALISAGPCKPSDFSNGKRSLGLALEIGKLTVSLVSRVWICLYTWLSVFSLCGVRKVVGSGVGAPDSLNIGSEKIGWLRGALAFLGMWTC